MVQFAREVFLKSSMANSFCPLWRGRAEILANPSARSSRPTLDSSSEIPNSSYIQNDKSARRQRTTPWIDISYETVRLWVLKFGQAYARRIRKRRDPAFGVWHMG